MPKRRISKRVPFRSNIRYGITDPPEHTSFIMDFSDTGVYIKTNRLFTPGTKLYLLINTPHGQFKACGIVVWAKKAPPHLVRHMKSGMGIQFTSVEKGLIELYRDKT